MFSELYNTEILTLSASLENAALNNPHGSARKVSKLCGSWVEVDVKLGEDGRVIEAAMRVQACALGQASAAILKAGIIGASLEALSSALDALSHMLKSNGAPPKGRFERLKILSGVADYPARHASTLLAFEAAVDAVERARVN